MSKLDKTVDSPFDDKLTPVPSGTGVNVERVDGAKGYRGRTQGPNTEPAHAGLGRSAVQTTGGKIPTPFAGQVTPTKSTKQS